MPKQKIITIQGTDYPVVFTMKTVVNFEEITDKSFFGVEFTHLTDRIAIILAAIYAANPDADLTVDSLMGAEDFQTMKDVIAAFTTIMELSTDFFKIPKIEQEAEPAAPAAEPTDEADEEEVSPKN